MDRIGPRSLVQRVAQVARFERHNLMFCHRGLAPLRMDFLFSTIVTAGAGDTAAIVARPKTKG
jgi:hypothetical protein